MKNIINNRNSLLVRHVAETYHHNKLFLFENENGYLNSRTKEIEDAYFAIYHVEYIINKILDEDDALIIKKEVVERESSGWYKKYMSESKYYKTRQRAYTNFLREIK